MGENDILFRLGVDTQNANQAVDLFNQGFAETTKQLQAVQQAVQQAGGATEQQLQQLQRLQQQLGAAIQQSREQITRQAIEDANARGGAIEDERKKLADLQGSLEKLLAKRKELSSAGEDTGAIDRFIKGYQGLIAEEERRLKIGTQSAKTRREEILGELAGLTSIEEKVARLKEIQSSFSGQLTAQNKQRLAEVNQLIAAYENEAKAKRPIEDATKRIQQVERDGVEKAIDAAKKRAASVEGEVRSIQRLELELQKLQQLQREASDGKQRSLIGGAINAVQAELNAAKSGVVDYGAKLQGFFDQLKAGGNTLGSFIQGLGRTGLVAEESIAKFAGLAEVLGISGASVDGLVAGFAGFGEALAVITGPVGIATAAVAALVTAFVEVAKVAVDADLAVLGFLDNASKEAAKFQSTLFQLAQVTGATREQVAAISLGLEKFGLNSLTAGVMLERLTGKAVEAAKENKKSKEAFEAFGISVLDAAGDIKDAGTLFEEIAKQTQGLTLDFRQKEALVELFTLRGVKAFEIARTSYKGYIDTIKEFGVTLSREQEKQLAAYRENAIQLEIAQKRVFNALGAAAGDNQINAELIRLIETFDLTGQGAQELAQVFVDFNATVLSVLVDGVQAGVDSTVELYNAFNQILTLGAADEVRNIGDLFQDLANKLRYTAEIVRDLGDFLFPDDVEEQGQKIASEYKRFNKQIEDAARDRVLEIQKLLKLNILSEKDAAAQIKAIQDRANQEALRNLERQAELIREKLAEAQQGSVRPSFSTAKIGFDPAQQNLDSRTKESEAAIAGLQAQLEKATRRVEEFKKGMEQGAGGLEVFRKSVLGAGVEIEELVKKYGEINKQITESTTQRVETIKSQVLDGAKTEIEAAKEVYKTYFQADTDILLNLKKAQALAQKAFQEVQANPGNFTYEVAEKITGQYKKATEDLEKFRTEITRRENENRRAIEAAAAKEREELVKKETSEIRREAAAQTDAVNQKESDRTITYRQAVAERAAITRNAIEQEIALRQKSLEGENISAAERKRTEQEVADLRVKLQEEETKSNRALREAEQKDAKTALDTKLAQLDQEIAKKEILIDQARQQGATSQELAALEQQLLNLQLEGLDAQISAARETGASEAELVQLQTERLRLIAQIKAAQLQASGEIADAINAEAAAYQQTGQAAEDAANKAKSASNANLGSIYSFIESLGRQATNITRDNIDEMLTYLQQRVNEATTGLANAAPRISGIFEYYTQQANEALNKLREKQAGFAAEDARKRAEERQQEAERQAQEEASIRERALDAEQDANQRLADAQNDYREGVVDEDKQWLAERQRIIDQGNQALANIEAQRAQARIQRAQDEANRLLQIARDLEDSREQAALESSQRQADSEFDRVNREIELQNQLEAAKASGDPDKVAGIQAELDGIQADRNRDAQRAEEERLAREKATSDEELAILLDGIEEKYQRQEAYENAVAALGANASAAQLAQLQAAYQDQLASLESTKQAELANLAEREEQARLAREKEAQEQEAAFQKQIDDQKQQNIDLLATAEQGHRDRLDALKATLQSEKDAHAEAMAAIRANLEAELAKMTEAWKKYADDTKSAIGSGGGGSGGGTTAGVGGSTGGSGSGLSTGGGGGGNTAGVGGGGATAGVGGSPPPNTQTGGGGQGGSSNSQSDAERAREILGNSAANDARNAGSRGNSISEAKKKLYRLLANAKNLALNGLYDQAEAALKEAERVLPEMERREAIEPSWLRYFKDEIKSTRKYIEVAAGIKTFDDAFSGSGNSTETTTEPPSNQEQGSSTGTATEGNTSTAPGQPPTSDLINQAAQNVTVTYGRHARLINTWYARMTEISKVATAGNYKGAVEEFNVLKEEILKAIKDKIVSNDDGGRVLAYLVDLITEAERVQALIEAGPSRFGTGGETETTGDAGGVTATGPGRQSPGPPATNTTPPATSAPPPKPARNEKLANDLVFAAQNATTKEKGQAVLKAATEALKAGVINDDDRGRIRAILDSVAFQNNYLDGFDTSALGQNSTTRIKPPGTPGTPGAPGRVGSVSDAQSALSSSAIAPPSQILGTGAVPVSDIPPPQPPVVNIDVGGISGNSEQEIIDKLVQKVREGLNDAGVTT